jgi:hypothetical protein
MSNFYNLVRNRLDSGKHENNYSYNLEKKERKELKKKFKRKNKKSTKYNNLIIGNRI